MANPFESSWLKIERAEHHIRDFQRHLRRFLKKRPYEVSCDFDPQTGYYVHRAKLTEGIPSALPLISADAVHNLKAALDHTMDSIAGVFGLKRFPEITRLFPSGGDEVQYGSSIKGRCAGFPVEIQTLFGRFKIYPGGNDILRALNAVCNRDKHGFTQRVAIDYRSVTVSSLGPDIFRPADGRWDRSKNHIELFRSRVPMSETDYDLRLSLCVTLDGAEVLDGNETLTALNLFVRETKDIILALEIETKRIAPQVFT